MGLLSQGTPLPWQLSKKHHAYIKEHGVEQFLNLYRHYQSRSRDVFLWGDEVESILVKFGASPESKTPTVRLCLRGADVLKELNHAIAQLKSQQADLQFHANFLPEYGCFMIEATPGLPYGGTTADLMLVEHNMKLRRQMIESALQPGEHIITTTVFPIMGVQGFTDPPHAPGGPVTTSDFIPDAVISPHPRFATLTANIRERRGSKVNISVPRYQDTHTRAAAEQAGENPDTILMDAMAFGMGMCCLQVTFQARSIQEARRLYDPLAVLGPMLMALTAATPCFRGRLADIDARWTVISQSVDDRTPEERGEAPLPADGSQQRIHKSRYDTIDSFLSEEDDLKESYNDLDLVIHQSTYDRLRREGIDHVLAQHIAHLFIRDPLVCYDELIKLDDKKSSDHFENIQSTNWQNVRFKPPPMPNVHDIGWRVEFRTMEIQPTDFENAAYTVFVALLSRAILFFKLNLYIPISKCDENMRRAHLNDACRKQRFYFRRFIRPSSQSESKDGADDYYREMTIAEIMTGSAEFPGLIPIVRSYLDVIKCDRDTMTVMNKYLRLIHRRATGRLLTPAQFLRGFILQHPEYKQDSIINDTIAHDMLKALVDIERGTVTAPQLFANLYKKDSQGAPEEAVAPSQLLASPMSGPHRPPQEPPTVSLAGDSLAPATPVQIHTPWPTPKVSQSVMEEITSPRKPRARPWSGSDTETDSPAARAQPSVLRVVDPGAPSPSSGSDTAVGTPGSAAKRKKKRKRKKARS